jgi:hypothetical protein
MATLRTRAISSFDLTKVSGGRKRGRGWISLAPGKRGGANLATVPECQESEMK